MNYKIGQKLDKWTFLVKQEYLVTWSQVLNDPIRAELSLDRGGQVRHGLVQRRDLRLDQQPGTVAVVPRAQTLWQGRHAARPLALDVPMLLRRIPRARSRIVELKEAARRTVLARRDGGAVVHGGAGGAPGNRKVNK